MRAVVATVTTGVLLLAVGVSAQHPDLSALKLPNKQPVDIHINNGRYFDSFQSLAREAGIKVFVALDVKDAVSPFTADIEHAAFADALGELLQPENLSYQVIDDHTLLINNAESGVQPPRLLHRVYAHYTSGSMKRGVEGMVTVECLVRNDGTIGEARVLKSLDPGDLDDAVLNAARQWRFLPAMREGKPVEKSVTIEMTFSMYKGSRRWRWLTSMLGR